MKGMYSQQFIVFVTYEWDQKARVLHYNGLGSIASKKYSGLSITL